MKKKILAAVLLVLVGIQLVRPAKNLSTAGPGPNDITVLHPTPPAVQAILARACYDCHSDNTHYPWYAEVQPVAWWLASHVNDGKRHLNFSQFGGYSENRATRKMNQTLDQIRDHEMPLWSYLLIHRDAQLSESDVRALEDWAQSVRERIGGR